MVWNVNEVKVKNVSSIFITEKLYSMLSNHYQKCCALWDEGPVLSSLFSVQFSSIQFSSIQFNSVQSRSVQFSSDQISSVQTSSVQLLTILLLSHITIYFSSVQFSSVQIRSVQFSSIQFSSDQFSSIQFNSVQFSSVQLFYAEENRPEYSNKTIIKWGYIQFTLFLLISDLIRLDQIRSEKISSDQFRSCVYLKIIITIKYLSFFFEGN